MHYSNLKPPPRVRLGVMDTRPGDFPTKQDSDIVAGLLRHAGVARGTMTSNLTADGKDYNVDLGFRRAQILPLPSCNRVAVSLRGLEDLYVQVVTRLDITKRNVVSLRTSRGEALCEVISFELNTTNITTVDMVVATGGALGGLFDGFPR